MVLDVRDWRNLYDYFVICSGESDRQVRAIYESVLKKCKQERLTVHHREDDKSTRWLLVDVFDVLLHIFVDEAREFYNLEYLWRDAKKINLPKPRKS